MQAPQAALVIPSIGDFIRRKREKYGIQGTHLADQVGITKSHLCKIELGHRDVPCYLAVDFARCLNCNEILDAKLRECPVWKELVSRKQAA